jgi:putative flippase GtrA
MNLKTLFDRRFLKFIFVGVINTLVGAAIMFVSYNIAGLDYWLSSAANYVLTSVLSFFLNKHFTFGVKQRSWKMAAVFVLTIAAAYFLAYGIAKPVMYVLLKNHPQQIRDNAALILGMCVFTGLNYMGQRFIVFGGNRYV